MKNVLKLDGLTKEYKDFKLGELDIEIPCGFATALIGSNGAGKTTLIDILCGVAAKTSGTIEYFEETTNTEDPNVKNDIGYCSSANFFPQDWTFSNIADSMEIAFDNFDRVKFSNLCSRFKWFENTGKKQKKLYTLSDGNKMRAYLSAVFARDTRLLVLDEPASSLDPLARELLCELFREYLAQRDGERSILFSTHNIADMEFATDYAVIMAKGKIIESGFVEDLKEKYVLVHGEPEIVSKASSLMLTYTSNNTAFEGIALVDNKDKLLSLDAAIEAPSLQQLCIGLLRKAEQNE